MENEKVGIKDIIALALKGYKPGEIKELIDLAKAANSESGSEQENTHPEDHPEQPDGSETEDDEKENPPESSDSEQLKAEIISLKEKIKELQGDNINKEVNGSENKTDEEKFEELVKNFI